MRTYVDRDGTEWQVWKVTPESRMFIERRSGDRRCIDCPPPDEEERRGGGDRRQGDIQKGWLCFGSAGERRRLYPVPPEWESCSEDRLDLLRKVAKKVGTPTASPTAEPAAVEAPLMEPPVAES